MATLAQQLGSFENRKRVFQSLGGQGPYTGSLQQNTWLLQNKPRWAEADRPAAPAQPAAPQQDAYDVLKQTLLGDKLLGSEVAFEDINPFSKYFNEELFRNSLQQGIKPEIDRVTGNLKADDASYRAREQQTFDNNTRALNQGFQNRGAFFGGARQAQNRIAADTRQRGLNDYTRDFTNRMLETERGFNRTIEDQVGQEKIKKTQGYNEEKTNYYKNPNYK